MEDACIMAEIITDGSQKELKKHGSDEFRCTIATRNFRLQIRLIFLLALWHPEIEIAPLSWMDRFSIMQPVYLPHESRDILLGNAMYSHRLHGRYERQQNMFPSLFCKDYLWFYGSILRRKYVEPFFTQFLPSCSLH